MYDSIVISAGTAGAAAVREFLEKLTADTRECRGKLEVASDEDRPRWVKRLEQLTDGVQVRAFDVDGTGVFERNTPLVGELEAWPIGTFVKLPMPKKDMIDSIQSGQHAGRFEQTNPEAVRALEGHGNASGGARQNGWVATEVNREIVEQTLRNCLTTIIKRRQTAARGAGETVRVIFVYGSFGGFGAGSHDLFRQILLNLAAELKLEISFTCIQLLPASNQSKDPDNTAALTLGTLKELVAQAAGGFHRHRRRVQGSMQRETFKTRFVPTIFLSDTNNAPGEPQALSIPNYNGMICELLRAWLLTPLGPRLDALAADFEAPAQELTADGETRHGRSIGVSLVHLDRERILLYAKSRLTRIVTERAIAPVEDDLIGRSVRAFFEEHRLVEGNGVLQLSTRLLESRDARHHPVDPDRFRRMFRNNTAGQTPKGLFDNGAHLRQVSMQQAGGLSEALGARSEAILTDVVHRASERVADMIRDRRIGLAGARQWVEQAIAIAETMHVEASATSEELERRIEQADRTVAYFDETYIPTVRNRNALYWLVRRRRIEAQALQYRNALEQAQISSMRQMAHETAVRLLGNLSAPLNTLLGEIQIAVDVMTALGNAATVETDRLAAHNPDYACPVGLPLVKGAEDLESYYERLLASAGAFTTDDEERAVADVHARLLQVSDPLAAASDESTLAATLDEAVDATFRASVEALHVVTELRRRYPDRDALGAVLRQRVRESYEFLQLNDATDQLHGVYTIRLLGVDGSRAGDLADLTNQFGERQGSAFQLIDTGDADRIVLMQARGVFPMSSWAHFPRLQKTYERVSREISFEKYHANVTERSLPTPGRPMHREEAQLVLLKAWLCGRLDQEPSGGRFQVRSGNGGGPLMTLTAGVKELSGQEGYRTAVDVLTDFGTRYFAQGPSPILERLQDVKQLLSAQAAAATPVQQLLVSEIDAKTINAVESELDWWRKNSLPGAMAWS